MGYELLETVTDLLNRAGFRAGEEYPAGERMEILCPAAAVGLRELDPAAGQVCFVVRILSPRMLGGWCCQVWAARAAEVLSDVGMTCQSGEMEYQSGTDCFCVVLTARWPVIRRGEVWVPGKRWQVAIGDVALENVESFQAVRSQGRRIVGASCQREPVGITSGSGGWELELIQFPVREPGEEEEPFTLTLRDGAQEIWYTGCCWNETVWDHDQRGLRLTRRGFALGREVNLVA